MSNFTAEEIADVLERASDEMMIRGRCTGTLWNAQGEVCLHGAIYATYPLFNYTPRCSDDVVLQSTAYRTMSHRGFGWDWNDSPFTTDDDVHEAFRQTAKGLRNGEIQVP